MHIKIDKNNKVSDIHIEKWDQLAIPLELAGKLLEQKGVNCDDFINFAFINKLFIYTKTLFLMRKDGGTLYLWAFSPLYSKEYCLSFMGYGSLLKSMKNTSYVTFSYQSNQLQPFTYLIARDGFLADMFQSHKMSQERLDLSLNSIGIDEVFNLFGLFNIVRNGTNRLNFIEDIPGKPIKIRNTLDSDYGYVVTIDNNDRLYALSTEEVLSYSEEELKQFRTFIPTETLDKEHSTSLNLAMNHILDIKIESNVRSKKLPSDVDKEFLIEAIKRCYSAIGSIKDLSIELQNTIANIYYLSIVFLEESSQAGFLSKNKIGDYLSTMSHIVTCVESIPEYVKSLREVENKKTRKKLSDNVILDLKYDVLAHRDSRLKKWYVRFKNKAVFKETPELYVFFE